MSGGTSVTVVNRSINTVIFSGFDAGDDGVPVATTVVAPNSRGELNVGEFKSIGVGVRAQAGGVWIAGDPKDPPYASPGQTLTLEMAKAVS